MTSTNVRSNLYNFMNYNIRLIEQGNKPLIGPKRGCIKLKFKGLFDQLETQMSVTILQLLLLIPGRLLVLVAHNEVLVPRRQRGTQAGGRVVERMGLLGNVDQRRLEHLLHLHHRRGLQTAIPHLPHPRPDH